METKFNQIWKEKFKILHFKRISESLFIYSLTFQISQKHYAVPVQEFTVPFNQLIFTILNIQTSYEYLTVQQNN